MATGLSWAGAGLWDSRGTLPAIPVLAPLVLVSIAGILLVTALNLRSRLKAMRERKPVNRPVEPLMATRAVLFGQASALVSALVGGVYGGTGLFLVLERWDTAPRREQALYSGLAVLAATAVCAVALYLERVCRLTEEEDDGPAGQPV